MKIFKIIGGFKKSVWLFALLCAGTSVLALVSYFKIPPEHLKISLQYGNAQQLVANWVVLSLLIYGAIWFCVSHIQPAQWKKFLYVTILFFGINASIAVATPPTQSQDIYWNLAFTKNWIEYDIDPYKSTINSLPQNEWTEPVIKWRNLPMIYGPIWPLFLYPFVKLGFGLATTLMLLKSFFVLLTVVTGWLWWKTMDLLKWDETKKTKIFAITALSPFIWQVMLVDLHNEIFILLSILASYYFILQKKYYFSIISLFFGGFVKYIPWLLVIVPLRKLLIKEGSTAKKVFTLIKLGFIFSCIALVLYLPFGWPWQNIGGISTELQSTRVLEFQTFTTYIWSYLPFVEPIHYRIAAAVLAIGLVLWFLYNNKILESYVWPYVAVLLFATPWCMPWYILWFYPLLTFTVSLNVIALLNMSLMLMQISTPLIGSYLGAIGLILYFLLKYLLDRTNIKIEKNS